ncbi:type III secretion system chaperone [Citrobacter freundii]|uniref:type III secretion system chaperone n=1 Tax=Citrobacter freundii TaxID=546 RepID=UPI00300D52CD
MINPVEYKEKFTNLVSALGRHTGGTTPTVNDNGVSFFSLSDMLFSFILSDPDDKNHQELICIIHIAPLSNENIDNSRSLYLHILKDNHSWRNTAGGIFGFDEQTECLCLSLRLDLLTESEDSFLAKIACAYQISLEWKNRLTGMNEILIQFTEKMS